MEWKDLEKMTVLKLRDEALKFPEIEGVHGKTKEELMDELAPLLHIEKPHSHFSDQLASTKGDMKHKINELKIEREKFIAAGDHKELREVRRTIRGLKREIRKVEAKGARG